MKNQFQYILVFLPFFLNNFCKRELSLPTTYFNPTEKKKGKNPNQTGKQFKTTLKMLLGGFQTEKSF